MNRLLIAMLLCSNLFGQNNAHSFCAGNSRIMAILQISAAAHQPVGILYTPSLRTPCPAEEVLPESPDRAMSAIAGKDYSVRKDDGVLIVEPRLDSQESYYPQLYIRISKFAARSDTRLADLSNLLWMDVQLAVDSTQTGFATSYSSVRNAKRLPRFNIADKTVMQILNALVTAHWECSVGCVSC